MHLEAFVTGTMNGGDLRSSDDINDAAEVPANGVFFSSDKKAAQAQLPDYQPNGISFNIPLTLTDCHAAMMATIHQVRLIVFEIARKETSVFRRRLTSVKLTGDAREFDESASSVEMNFVPALSILIIDSLQWNGGARLMTVLRRPLEADHEYKECLAKLKTSLLRIEKDVIRTVTSPLKKALINKKAPDFKSLSPQATRYYRDITAACSEYRDVAGSVCRRIQGDYRAHEISRGLANCPTGGPGWREASALNDQINKLEDQVRDKGWSIWVDGDYATLDDGHAFERADGPSSVIAYLEKLLKRLDEGRDRSHNGEQQ
ncbi:hypothetical protein LTR91_004097 [Friedmanniomyces endolithicus]|uniref:Uncharacterized protein n=1 Tax=Friedmanniomyces endolithicus TaxID=329885 RepID=A0AAN6KV68_9PEZI|nr:hypothetical protein LTR94_000584 [Friedmanniomyces endolithicus]KAK0788235.1 hypothetical protein LTR59_010056 [Friedmanniomyces endolithicus]KAK0815656.1 hypothetical protein LTR38_002302 [Friedmanniomyces endolithicus]KAK0821266.1 hypothetical protein LTR75_000739 [Friedmanniomyces endolithicus]KAK0857574.1 hypothetical protein LTR03_000607 [Friedmanniomyces endolithicus]